MSSFCTTHIFFSKKFQNICVSLDVNFNESLTNVVVSFEQLGPVLVHILLTLSDNCPSFLNQQEENDRNDFTINLHGSYVAELRFKPANLASVVRCASNCVSSWNLAQALCNYSWDPKQKLCLLNNYPF